MEQALGPPMLRFGPYVVDLAAGEVRKNGYRIRLQEKPLRVLVLLAERQGQLVTREELKNRLWADETFVDFEAGLNTAVSKLRDSLLDSADKPRYIETIPRRGYRFLVPVEFENGHHPPAATLEDGQRPESAPALIPASEKLSDPAAHAAQTEPYAKSAKRATFWILLAAVVILVASGVYWWTHSRAAL
jgi:DNA-binding winged helix-turn-helix (wHTH) protein